MRKKTPNLLIVLTVLMVISGFVFARRPAIEPISSIAIDGQQEPYSNAQNSPGHSFTSGKPKRLERTLENGSTYTPPHSLLQAENHQWQFEERTPASDSGSTPGEIALLLLFLSIPYMVWSAVLRRVESDHSHYTSDMIDIKSARKSKDGDDDNWDIPQAS
ncbi:MAG: hypothetical protein HN353_13500 [Bdellovibrionales bacterium]|nr:hypothetical protein [Bdellovibrionales bacterium]MBT3524892.1 hypothetical protein [Bdellovibrionales bacterium]MBT7669297.1 hypothetical protein [Bdellovibrionales bacterium]MBT7768238.1 hypothetical protein [Bdellovibrionales bacterium]